MSIASEVSRIAAAKTAIATAVAGKGVTVPSGTLLDGMAALIDGIEAGASATFTPATTGTFDVATFENLSNLYGVALARIDERVYGSTDYYAVDSAFILFANINSNGTTVLSFCYNSSSSYYSPKLTKALMSFNWNNYAGSNYPFNARRENDTTTIISAYVADTGSLGFRVGETYKIVPIYAN